MHELLFFCYLLCDVMHHAICAADAGKEDNFPTPNACEFPAMVCVRYVVRLVVCVRVSVVRVGMSKLSIRSVVNLRVFDIL